MEQCSQNDFCWVDYIQGWKSVLCANYENEYAWPKYVSYPLIQTRQTTLGKTGLQKGFPLQDNCKIMQMIVLMIVYLES